MGEKDLAKAEKLLTKAEGTDRAWLAACIGQYHRTQRKEPIDGIKVLLSECLGNKAAKDWSRKLKTAESARIAEWREQAQTNRLNRIDPPLKPTGLAMSLPPLNHLQMTTENAPAALELSRCLAELGDIHSAIRVIDMCGSKLQDNEICLVLSYEALADLNQMNRDFDRAVKGYGNALKIFAALAKRKKDYGEGFSNWEASSRARIERKLRELKRLIEADKFGKGWVDYRDAQRVRLKDRDYVRALLMYDKIIDAHPQTVYESAARCYSIKCLLELAKQKRPRRGEDSKSNELEKKYADEKAFLKLAKRCKVPEAGLTEIRERIEAIQMELDVLDEVPYGEAAYEEGKARAREASKQVWGLYVGEILFDLAMYELEGRLDPKAAEPYFRQASMWFDKVRMMNSALASYQVPSKAVEISRPPETERIKDAWGNILKSQPDVGDIFNRKSSSWYWRHYRKKVALYSGLLAYMKRDFELARSEWNTLIKVDRFFQDCEKERKGSSWNRLMWNIENNDGCLYATKEEMQSFRNPKRRLIVFLADLAYESENHEQALEHYESLLNGRFGMPTKNERAFLVFAKHACMRWLGDSGANSYLTKHLSHMTNTPSEPRALLAMATWHLSHGTPKGRQEALYYLETLRNKCPESDEAKDSYFYSGWTLAKSRQFETAIKYLTRYITFNRSMQATAAQLITQINNR